MKGKVLLIIIGLGVGLAVCLYSPAPAHACTTTFPPTVAPGDPTPTPIPTPIPPSIATRTRSVSVVLEGVVLDVQGNNPETATIKVSRYFKGSGRETIEISGFMGVYCRPNVTRGEHAIFFANGDSGSNLKSYTDYGTASRTEPTPTNIAEVISTTGQQPALPTDVTPTATPIIATPTIPAPIPTPTPTVTTQTETGNNMWLWVGLGAVVVIGGGAFLLTKRRR